MDDGYSAFKGHHISKGALGRFLTLADKGKYKGYALVVEQMDRLSRQGIIEPKAVAVTGSNPTVTSTMS